MGPVSCCVRGPGPDLGQLTEGPITQAPDWCFCPLTNHVIIYVKTLSIHQPTAFGTQPKGSIKKTQKLKTVRWSLTTAWLELSCRSHSRMWLSAREMTLFPSPVGSHVTLQGRGGPISTEAGGARVSAAVARTPHEQPGSPEPTAKAHARHGSSSRCVQCGVLSR